MAHLLTRKEYFAGKSDGGGGSWYSMGEYSVNLMDKLGQGSYGVVYRGKEKKSGKTIAIKQIKISQEGQGKWTTILK